MLARCERRAKEQSEAKRVRLGTEHERTHECRAREQPEARQARQARLNRQRECNHERSAMEQPKARHRPGWRDYASATANIEQWNNLRLDNLG